MIREGSVEEFSDGRFYTAQDMVRIGNNDCAGCSDCCRMGAVIVLDPLDVFELNRFLSETFALLLGKTAELKLIDGLILPVLKMIPADDQAAEGTVCPYLSEEGRCSIHAFRPGICRLYPLGRYWEGGDFRYILQRGECTHPGSTKVKIRKWLGIPDLARYEDFCRSWHALLEQVRSFLAGEDPDGQLRRRMCVVLLKEFYEKPWADADFYTEYEAREREVRRQLGFASPG